MHTIPNEDKGKLLKIGLEIASPKVEIQKADYGSGSAGLDTEERVSSTKEELREAIEKIDAASKKEEVPERGMDPF